MSEYLCPVCGSTVNTPVLGAENIDGICQCCGHNYKGQSLDSFDKISSLYDSPIDRHVGSLPELSSIQEIEKMAESPLVQHLREFEESPVMKSLREFEESSVMKSLREFEESSVMKSLREFEESPVMKHLRELEESPLMQQLRMMNETPIAQHIREIEESSLVKYLREVNEFPSSTVSDLARFDELAFGHNNISRSIADSINGFQSASQSLADIITPLNAAAGFSLQSNWRETLTNQVGRLHLDWLDTSPTRSLVGFAHLSRLHEALDFESPFSSLVSDLVNEELGRPENDEGYVDEPSDEPLFGFNESLTAFQEDSYSEVVITAGFQLKLPDIKSINGISDGDKSAQFYPEAGPIVTHLELSLRHAVCLVAGKIGVPFHQLAPGDVLSKCKERRDICRQANEPVLDLIHYADFMDLLKLIQLKKMWKGEFENVFFSREDIVSSMHRVSLTRNAIFHSRPLRKDQYLTLVVEAHRIRESLRAAKLINN
ncbi:hypothetical protein [Halomonas sp. WWR20]